MTWDFETLRTFAIIIHILSLVTIAIMGFFILTRLKSTKREYFVLIAFSVFLSMIGIIFEMMANTVDGGMLGWRLVYLGGMLLAPLLLMFVQQYCEIHLPKIINCFAFATAFAVIALTWTTHLHHLIVASAQIYPGGSPGPGLTVWGATNGPLWPIVVIQPILCMILVFYVLLKKSKGASKTQKKRLWILLLFAAPPGISQILTFFHLSFMGMHWNGIIAPIALIILYLGLSRYDLMENEETIRAQNWLREMVTNLSHDLKTPLTVVSVHVQQAAERYRADGGDNAIITNSLRRGQDEIMRMARMTESALRIAAMQEIYTHMEALSIGELLTRSAETYRAVLLKKGNALDVNIPADLPEVIGNADQLTRVMDNLLTNAGAHTENGRVAVNAWSGDGYITAQLTDTGTGIESELLPVIFERGVSGSGGAGMGLPICKSIIEAHGGTIQIESKTGSGTAVTFTIPIFGKGRTVDGNA